MPSFLSASCRLLSLPKCGATGVVHERLGICTIPKPMSRVVDNSTVNLWKRHQVNSRRSFFGPTSFGSLNVRDKSCRANSEEKGTGTTELPARPASVQIHPTALVDPSAILGEDVSVGAFCTVGPDVTLGDGCSLAANVHIFGSTQLGRNNQMLTGAILGSEHPGTTLIGEGNIFGHNSCIGVKCQDLKYNGGECFLIIGDHNDFREGVQIHRSSAADLKTKVGDHNLLMGGCHVAHDCWVGSRNILANNTLLAGHVMIGDGAVIGGAVAVCPFCEIGSYAFLAGGSMVEGDVPACMRAKGDRATLQGVNFEGLKRNGFSESEVAAAQRACKDLFRGTSNHSPEELAKRAEDLMTKGGFSSAEAGDGSSTITGRSGPMYASGGTHPAEMLLTSVVRGLNTNRKPRPCGWRQSSAITSSTAELEAKVAALEAELAVLKEKEGKE